MGLGAETPFYPVGFVIFLGKRPLRLLVIDKAKVQSCLFLVNSRADEALGTEVSIPSHAYCCLLVQLAEGAALLSSCFESHVLEMFCWAPDQTQ